MCSDGSPPEADLPEKERTGTIAPAVEAAPGKLAALLRRHGLPPVAPDARKNALDRAGTLPRRPHRSTTELADARRVHDLERELPRGKRALAGTAAIIAPGRTTQGILGDEDHDAAPTGR